jgi:hypothetical protein
VTFRFYRAFTVPKDTPDANEDFCRWNGDGSVCAVCDGASTSYDSKGWAYLLCRAFTRVPKVTENWIQRLAAHFNEWHDRDSLPWMKQAAFDRGSFSTLLGIRVMNQQQVAEVFAVGDTIVAMFDSEVFRESYPYREVECFDADPILLSTLAHQNAPFTNELLKESVYTIDLPEYKNPILFAMTDALGRWVLERRFDNDLVKKFLDFDKASFASFILEERAEHRMRRDDTTLLIMRRSDEVPSDC